jgi:hypothetical protein
MAGVPYAHSSRWDLLWEGDVAHQACRSWAHGWREANPDRPPPLSAARAVGESARRLADAGVGRVELARLMTAAGRDGDPSPDLHPGATPQAEAA